MAARRRCWGTDKRSARKRKLEEKAEDVLEGLKRYDLSKRPEVRIINRYVYVRTFVMVLFKAVGSLALLWSAAVHLGGFFHSSDKDFWDLTFIGFVQAAGIFNVLADDQFIFILSYLLYPYSKLVSLIEKLQKHVMSRLLRTSEEEEISMSPACQAFYNIISVITHMVTPILQLPVIVMAVIAPAFCLQLSLIRLARQDYGSANGHAASKANLKPALNIFYSLAMAQSFLYLFWIIVELSMGGPMLYLCNLYRYERRALDDYITETKRKCIHDMSLPDDWNLITYALSLLDSESLYSDDYCSGLRILNALIEEKVPVNRLMTRSSKQRIQKLISALGWRRPIDREARELAARILAHLASDLSLADFPGALESVSSLLETNCYKKDQESQHFPLGKHWSRRRNRQKNVLEDMMDKQVGAASQQNYYMLLSHERGIKISNTKRERLILQALRIIENLAHNERNCTEICKNKDLLSKIIAPVSSKKIIEEVIKTYGDCSVSVRALDGTLKVVSRLIGAHGDICKNMRQNITGNTNKGRKDPNTPSLLSIGNMKTVVSNLVAILGLKQNSNILGLQTRAVEILTQLYLHESTNLDTGEREKFIQCLLQFFFSEEWMSKYLQETRREKIAIKVNKNVILWLTPSLKALLLVLNFEKRKNAFVEEHKKWKMEEAKEIASQLKAKAGEALALLLSTGSQSNLNIVVNLNGWEGVYLTQMLDSKITTFECKMSSENEVLHVPIKIGCRISAAEILKHLWAHSTGDHFVCNTVLSKLFKELLHTNTTGTELEARNVSMAAGGTSPSGKNDIERQLVLSSRQGHKRQIPGSNKQQCDKRRFHAALLSLYAAIRATWTAGDFAILIVGSVDSNDFPGKIKVMIKENSHGTPACLAMLKIICEMVTLLVQHGHYVEEFEKEKIMDALSKASKTVASLEGCMFFAGMDVDSYGVPLKPFSSALVEDARKLLDDQIKNRSRLQVANGTIIPAGTG